jgi:hypothetical protein
VSSEVHAAASILGSLRSEDGKGVARVQGRFAAGIEDVGSALTGDHPLIAVSQSLSAYQRTVLRRILTPCAATECNGGRSGSIRRA